MSRKLALWARKVAEAFRGVTLENGTGSQTSSCQKNKKSHYGPIQFIVISFIVLFMSLGKTLAGLLKGF
jgi:hypothetical protein